MINKELQEEIINYLKDKNIFCFPLTLLNKKQIVYILKNGVSIFVFIDIENADHQQRQFEVKKEIIQNGGLAYSIKSLDELKEII